jgi:hypothetical protein
MKNINRSSFMINNDINNPNYNNNMPTNKNNNNNPNI